MADLLENSLNDDVPLYAIFWFIDNNYEEPSSTRWLFPRQDRSRNLYELAEFLEGVCLGRTKPGKRYDLRLIMEGIYGRPLLSQLPVASAAAAPRNTPTNVLEDITSTSYSELTGTTL